MNKIICTLQPDSKGWSYQEGRIRGAWGTLGENAYRILVAKPKWNRPRKTYNWIL